MLLAGIGDAEKRGGCYVALVHNRLAMWSGGEASAEVSAELAPAAWHLAVLVTDGRSIVLYADGKRVGERAMTPPPAAAQLQIAPQIKSINHFGGQIAGLRILTAALNAEQVAGVYADRPDFQLPTYEEATKRW